MELRHLRYFVAVAEELHFSRAAERLHVSQPPLSQQIKQLEEELEVRLLDRTKRWVGLTSAGQRFLEHARHVLTEVDGAVLATRQTSGGKCDHLSIACTPWAAYATISQILRHFREKHRSVRIEIQTLNSVELRAVKTRNIDVAFLWGSSADEGLQIDTLLLHPLVVALPSRHRLAARTHLSPRDLVGESYVMLAADAAPVYSQAVARYWEKARGAVEEPHTADQPHEVLELVAAGAGFALVPLAVHEHAEPGIVYRRIDPAPQLELTLARARGVESPEIHALREVALQIARQGDPTAMAMVERTPTRARPISLRSARSSPLGVPQLTRDGSGKSIRTTLSGDVKVVQGS